MSFKVTLAALGIIASVSIFGAPSAFAETKSVTINPGDTLEAIATAHGTDYVRVFNANEQIANPDVINAGDSVRIPSVDEQLPDRYGVYAAALTTYVAAPAPASGVSNGTYGTAVAYQAAAVAPVARGVVPGNGYVWGNCTWYVKNMRADLPNNLGNGGSWTGNAAAQGYATGYAPRAGAVAEEPGHVAYVQSVNADGTINISEMNYAGGLGQVHTRTVPASNYSYIY